MAVNTTILLYGTVIFLVGSAIGKVMVNISDEDA